MFAGDPFYHASTRRYVAMFGSLFQNIVIERKASDGTVIKQIPVPLIYGPKAKYTTINDGREDTGIAKILPRMNFALGSPRVDTERQTNRLNKIKHSQHKADNTLNWSFGRVPYIFPFELNIKTKSMEDMLRIVEPILAYFDPSIYINVEDIDPVDLDVKQHVEIRLTEVNTTDSYDNDIEEPRIVEWRLGFELFGYLYKRVSNSKIILSVDITDWDAALQQASTVYVTANLHTNTLEAISFGNDLYTAVQRDLFTTAGSDNRNLWGVE